MTITVNELVTQLSTLGLIETAINGAFHNLPGSGGGGGTSNVQMIKAHVLQDFDSPPGTGVFFYDYPTPMAYPAFINVLILDPHVSTGPTDDTQLNYNVQVLANTTVGFGVLVSTSWNTPGKVDELPAFDQQLGIRLEPFEPTVTM
ncbi:hypothetical protein VCM_00186 [Pseudomonas phage VCM]|uniref:Uncharacterized protein n=1 Tax=Pseudomonas phage VCM TaxID=1729937 RepID=A0A0S4L179_9CAUD|nr:hypothetical protein VCM_00186 [Pseudomonas phage VCM]CUR44388.1 hypothetical protein VCM_00186 [Pseudomonas phage VCM]